MQNTNIKTLVGGALLSNDTNIRHEVMKDVLDSLLFFRLYADKELNKFDSSAAWFKRYDDAMIHLKWNTAVYDSEMITLQNDVSFTLETLIEEKMPGQLPAKLMEQFRELMTCVGKLTQRDKASLLFRQQAIRASADVPGRSDFMLQMGVLEPGIKLSSLFVTFSTMAEIDHDLWSQTFSPATIVGDINVRFHEREWNPKESRIVRGNSVQNFLAAKKEGLILPLSCEPCEEPSDD